MIDKISRNTFTGLNNLIDLNLSNNTIKAIEADTFQEIIQLFPLSLNNCPIDSFNSTILNNLEYLNYFYFSNNCIKEIEKTCSWTWMIYT